MGGDVKLIKHKMKLRCSDVCGGKVLFVISI